jgi:hypothetical protein
MDDHTVLTAVWGALKGLSTTNRWHFSLLDRKLAPTYGVAVNEQRRVVVTRRGKRTIADVEYHVYLGQRPGKLETTLNGVGFLLGCQLRARTGDGSERQVPASSSRPALVLHPLAWE